MICPLNKPECVKHTIKAHNAGCPGKDGNKCQDVIHTKTCWSKQDLELLEKILDNYLHE